MSVVFFKNLGLSNELIGLTSWLALPWTIKLFWGPFVDLIGTKRKWILTCQLMLTVLTGFLASDALTSNAIPLAFFVFAVMAFVSATQDIAIDGYYMEALTGKEQAYFIGIRSAAYKVAWLLGSGGLVFLAGKLGEFLGVQNGWAISFATSAVLFLVLSAFHSFYLPHPSQKSNESSGVTLSVFGRVFSTYFQQPAILPIVLYILTFRLGDALMLKMAQPFLLDPVEKGGLAISTADVGIIYGTVGMLFLIAGGILGGFLVSKDGLKKWLWPTALIQNSAILLYWLLALYKPGLTGVAVVNSIEQFSYGLGVSAYTVFLLTTVKQEFKAAHYAIATGMMALGLLVPQSISGYLVTWLGYTNFFLLSFCAAIPGIITIFFLPLNKIPETTIQSVEGESNGIQEVREVGPSC